MQKEDKQSYQRCRPSGLTPRKTNEVSAHTRELCSIGCFLKGEEREQETEYGSRLLYISDIQASSQDRGTNKTMTFLSFGQDRTI